jgi:hypothetical protein
MNKKIIKFTNIIVGRPDDWWFPPQRIIKRKKKELKKLFR